MIRQLLGGWLLFLLATTSLQAQRDYTSLVNPFIGTGGHGHTYPGASMPAGMVQLSPDTRLEGWDGCGGYHYSDSAIYGFSHTHLSGTGIPDYCDILFMPFTGNTAWDNQQYKSPFTHKSEKASPGYYEVMLDKHQIKARLTTTLRAGMHQYQFASGSEGAILIDLVHRDEVLDAYIEKVSDTEIRGYRRSKSWATDQHVYFYAKFDKPFTSFEINNDGQVAPDRKAQSKSLKAAIRFALANDKTVQAKVGISGVSMEGAKLNLDTEIAGWDFEKIKSDASTAWNQALAKVDVKGGTKDEQTVFYTALYHTLLAPNVYMDVDGQYRGTDLKVHKAEGFVNHSVFSLWDTYRGFNPLMTILYPGKVRDWINTFLVQYKNGGMLPVWELSGNETFCMIGYHAVPVIVDAYQKGIRGFDEKLALEAMLSYAESDRYGLDQYRRQGYVGNEYDHESASKTAEYAYDDWCIAQFAKMTGQTEVYRQYIQRAQYYKNIFDPATHHLRGKVRAVWYRPFDATEVNNFYTEGNSWQYSFAVPQDISGLMKLHGGKEKFAAKLNELFTTNKTLSGRDQQDVTGLIGQYAHGNEPSHHMAYLFNYAGMPWRTQELVHQVCREFYPNAPDGLIGNEDCGQMSAWYVLSAMGFYPVCPGNGEYALGTPLFDEVSIRLDNGRVFRITAKRDNAEAFYVQAANLDGKAYTKSYLLHTDIVKGGEFQFVLGKNPNKGYGVRPGDMPVTAITENLIVASPYFDVNAIKFRGRMDIALKNADPAAKLSYFIAPAGTGTVLSGKEKFTVYTKPFSISKNEVIYAIAEKNGTRSKMVSQPFYKIPEDRELTVLSEVNPMFTGGGNDILIDGLLGNENWKNGEWQGFYDRDFEAVMDLKQVKQVSYAGVHVVQDVSPWILHPKEVIIAVSNDGREYREVARVLNKVSNEDMKVQTQQLGASLNVQARYVKIKAVNGGKLPPSHESAGNPSHLFVDEVIVK